MIRTDCAFCTDTRPYTESEDEHGHPVLVHADEVDAYTALVRRKKIDNLENQIERYREALDRLRSEK